MDNFQEQFYQMVTRLKSRAASTSEERITEMINGVLVTRPVKKFRDETTSTTTTSEPKVIDLQEYAKSKAGSVSGINKLKTIIDFNNSNGRY